MELQKNISANNPCLNVNVKAWTPQQPKSEKSKHKNNKKKGFVEQPLSGGNKKRGSFKNNLKNDYMFEDDEQPDMFAPDTKQNNANHLLGFF